MLGAAPGSGTCGTPQANPGKGFDQVSGNWNPLGSGGGSKISGKEEEDCGIQEGEDGEENKLYTWQDGGVFWHPAPTFSCVQVGTGGVHQQMFHLNYNKINFKRDSLGVFLDEQIGGKG